MSLLTFARLSGADSLLLHHPFSLNPASLLTWCSSAAAKIRPKQLASLNPSLLVADILGDVGDSLKTLPQRYRPAGEKRSQRTTYQEDR